MKAEKSKYWRLLIQMDPKPPMNLKFTVRSLRQINVGYMAERLVQTIKYHNGIVLIWKKESSGNN